MTRKSQPCKDLEEELCRQRKHRAKAKRTEMGSGWVPEAHWGRGGVAGALGDRAGWADGNRWSPRKSPFITTHVLTLLYI